MAGGLSSSSFLGEFSSSSAANRFLSQFTKTGWQISGGRISWQGISPGQTVRNQEDAPLQPENRFTAVSTYGKTIALSVGKRRLGTNVIWATQLEARRIGDRTYYETFPIDVQPPRIRIIRRPDDDDPDDDPTCPCGGVWPSCAECVPEENAEPCCDENRDSRPDDYVDPPRPGPDPGGCKSGTRTEYGCYGGGLWTGLCDNNCIVWKRECVGLTAVETKVWDCTEVGD